MSDILLYFKADWCGPCKKMAPIIDKLVEKHGLSLTKTDVDRYANDAAAWKVTGVPTFIRLDRETGEEKARVVGAHPMNKMEKMLGLLPETS